MEAEALNARILENCRQLDYTGIRLIHVFLPITEKTEVNTWPLIEWLREAYPGLQWALSRADLTSGAMEHFMWDRLSLLVKNKYGIPEPAGGIPVQPDAIDLVFVPLLAFDKAGHRVGYGKGMYDRFLKQCRPNARTIGLSLFEPLQAIDTDATDVALQTVVTPEAIYHFSK